MDNNNQSENDNNKNNKENKNDDYHKKKNKLDDELEEYFNEIIPRKKIKTQPENDNIKFKIKKHHKCNNELCDHQYYLDEEENNWNNLNQINIKSIDTLKDLITLSKYYHCKMRKFFNGIDLKLLFDIKDNLVELDEMIGLSNIKEEVVNLIIHLLLIIDKNNILNSVNSNQISSDMLHCVITGSPGCGKTTFIEIYAKILTKLGISKYGHIVKVKRSDLIGKYLGHTAVQTQRKIDEAKGGILLIDEAYSLGNPEQRDSFSKECLDTLNQALSENKHNFICIIAGYAGALDSSFFAYNEGLKRRFPFRFDILPYTSEELSMILNKKILEYKQYDVKYELEELKKIIKKYFKNFNNQGGDMETLFLNIKINHNKRIFLLPIEEKNKLLFSDIKLSVEKFTKYKESEGRISNNLSHLYV
jgi:energy-coupling factor transporter ATP-binding protein EcfA2